MERLSLILSIPIWGVLIARAFNLFRTDGQRALVAVGIGILPGLILLFDTLESDGITRATALPIAGLLAFFGVIISGVTAWIVRPR
jgi:hypothetical protein